MDMTEHWRLRLLELFQSSGLKQAAFAELIDVQPDYFSRLLYEPGKKGRKNLGPVTQRKISQKFDLSPGWFDLPMGTDVPSRTATALGNAAYASHHSVQEPRADYVTEGTQARPWPFKIVTYSRMAKILDHFHGSEMPDALTDIDKHLDILVSRWEVEIEQQKRSAA